MNLSCAIDRRQFVSQAAASLLGVSALRLPAAEEEPAVSRRTKPARRIISLFMSGGLSQLETFSPCPEAPLEIRGDGRAIDTSADGMQISHYLPRTAKWMHQAVVFRTLNSNQGAHAEGRYFMKTNWRKRGTIQHPHLGSWAGKLAPPLNPELPGFVNITSQAKEIGAGFFGANYEPLIVRDPEAGLANATLRRKDTEQAMDHRINLASQLDAGFRAKYPSKAVKDYGAVFEATTRLMKSRDLDAFDISKETPARKKLYGSSRFGMGCLLARRLSGSGVRFVEVELGGWDTHADHFKTAPGRLNEFDQGLSALLQDLSESGELAETLITVATEFGRTPEINQNEGRDHFPNAFTGLIAGGGINGGQTVGEINKDGREIEDHKVDVTQFNATVAWALGLPVNETVYSPSRRPFTIANKATPLVDLFSI